MHFCCNFFFCYINAILNSFVSFQRNSKGQNNQGNERKKKKMYFKRGEDRATGDTLGTLAKIYPRFFILSYSHQKELIYIIAFEFLLL
jgi:hypothetical protein